MLCDGKQEGDWYIMIGRNVTIKKNHKTFTRTCEEIRISLNINGKFACISGHSIFEIIFVLAIISI